MLLMLSMLLGFIFLLPLFLFVYIGVCLIYALLNVVFCYIFSLISFWHALFGLGFSDDNFPVCICIYNQTVSSTISDKLGRVISGRKIVRVRRTRTI